MTLLTQLSYDLPKHMRHCALSITSQDKVFDIFTDVSTFMTWIHATALNMGGLQTCKNLNIGNTTTVFLQYVFVVLIV